MRHLVLLLAVLVLGCLEQPEPTPAWPPTPIPELVPYRACADCGNAWLAPNPEGVLHETVFEPVAISRESDSLSTGCAIVGADGVNGVLNPTSFTDDAGAAVTLRGIEWKPLYDEDLSTNDHMEWWQRLGWIELQLSPLRELANYEIDFIYAEPSLVDPGYWTVNTALLKGDYPVSDRYATSSKPPRSCSTNEEPDRTGTLSWTTYQPWQKGDKLTVRIRRSLLDGLRVLDLDYLEPVNFFDGNLIGINRYGHIKDGEIFTVDLDTGEWTQHTDDGHPKNSVAISANHLTWTDERRSVTGSSRDPEDVFVRDLRTGEERRITEEPASYRHLQISGSRLVWMEDRTKKLEDPSKGYLGYEINQDIYVYDLESSELISVAVGGSAQRTWPRIDGDIVIWADDRTERNRFHLYMRDLATDEERLLAEDWSGPPPSIKGRLVTLVTAEGIVQLDVEKAQRRIIFDRSNHGYWPTWSEDKGTDNYVAWSVVAGPQTLPVQEKREETGIFVYDRKRDKVRQISDDRVSHVWLYENVLVIKKNGVHGRDRGTYAVFLE